MSLEKHSENYGGDPPGLGAIVGGFGADTLGSNIIIPTLRAAAPPGSLLFLPDLRAAAPQVRSGTLWLVSPRRRGPWGPGDGLPGLGPWSVRPVPWSGASPFPPLPRPAAYRSATTLGKQSVTLRTVLPRW